MGSADAGRTGRVAATVAFCLTAWPVQAHSTLQGVGDFYGGLLHPLVVPAEALTIVAAGLLLGQSGTRRAQVGCLMVPVGIIAGLAGAQLLAGEWQMTTYLLALTLIMAAIVVAAVRIPLIAVAVLVLAAAVGIGIDAEPEASSMRGALIAAAGTAVGGTLAVFMIAALTVRPFTFWQTVAIRVAGSWLAAIAMLYLAWRAAGH